MPLIRSKSPEAFKRNVSTLMKERGKSPHVKDRAQALAIAYAVKRRGKAAGGPVKRAMGGFGPMGSPMMPSGALPPQPSATPTGGPMPGFGALSAFGAAPGAPLVQGAARSPQAVPSPTMGAMPPRGYAIGGSPVPWFVRNEARGMMHTGPIMSAVPGRTDRHNINVPAGSYIVPSETVSHLGQNNTTAGMKVLNGMFGASGPYGVAAGRMPRAAAPAIRSIKAPADRGGGRGEGIGTPTPIVAAGGEFVIEPHIVAAIGKGDIKRGHAILDRWIMSMRKDHIRTLKKLPGPAKS